MNDHELMAPDVAKLIQLFSAQPDLRFPELDAGVLHEAVARLKETHLECVAAEAALQATRLALEREHEALLKLAQRAHAYLKVFAETDERLTAQVDAISLPKPRRGADPTAPAGLEAPRKRGRPRKDAGPSLFANSPNSAASSNGNEPAMGERQVQLS